MAMHRLDLLTDGRILEMLDWAVSAAAASMRALYQRGAEMGPRSQLSSHQSNNWGQQSCRLWPHERITSCSSAVSCNTEAKLQWRGVVSLHGQNFTHETVYSEISFAQIGLCLGTRRGRSESCILQPAEVETWCLTIFFAVVFIFINYIDFELWSVGN